MDTLIKDIRYGIRGLVRHPGFTLIAVITLALGIGANTAIFSVVNSVLLRPLPFADPDRIIWVWDTQPQLATAPTSLPDFLDWKEENRSFEHLAAYLSGNMFFDAGNGAEDIPVGLVTPETFALFRVSPILGRTFTEAESLPGQTSRLAVLSYSTWQNKFGADPNVVGRTIQLSGATYSVIGVMQAGFSFPERAQLWRPLPVDPKQLDRGPHYLRVVGRLKRDVTLAQAQADMSSIASRLAKEYPEKIAGHGVKLEPLTTVIVGDISLALFVLLGAVGFVLLIACANLANLMLARVGVRQREIAVRTALGASRLDIVRQLLTESIMLAVAGGLAGLLLALWAVRWLVSLSSDTIPRVQEITVDYRVATFTILLSLITGVLFGLAPALQISRPDLTDALKESGRTTIGIGGSRLRAALVMSEVALSLVLLVGAGLMIRSFAKLNQVDKGFDPESVLALGVALLPNKYPSDEQVANFYSQIIENVAAMPGVESVGAITDLPLSGSNTSDSFTIEGRPPIPKEAEPLTEYRVVTPQYFRSMGIPLLAGRDFTPSDTKRSPNVVIISEAFARQHFAGENPLDHRIRLQGQERDPLQIIGVVGDVRDLALDLAPTAEAYVPYLQNPLSPTYERSMTIVARTKSDPSSIVGSLRVVLTSLDRSLPVFALKPMTEYLRDSLARRRFNMILLSLFSGIALVLAAIGIYGVISYGVSQRTREMGIRMALGAQSRDVLKLVLRQAMMLTLGGIAIGLFASVALTRLMKSLLFSVSVTDPLTFAVIALLLALIALIACLIPAVRATRVDPLVALRYE
jgi:putative ABC transport system permease protein